MGSATAPVDSINRAGETAHPDPYGYGESVAQVVRNSVGSQVDFMRLLDSNEQRLARSYYKKDNHEVVLFIGPEARAGSKALLQKFLNERTTDLDGLKVSLRWDES